MKHLLLILCLALGLSACGTRGPLYLPPDATPAKPAAKPAPKAADDSKATTPVAPK